MSNVQRLRAILGGSAGNLVEWYDWFAYASFSLYFAPVFFPQGDQTSQLLQTAAVFAVGFFARPAGAWLMGLYADRAGRRAAMTISVALMCFGSLVIAVTPGHAVIGGAAPIILICARILQGLSVGGEYGASATYLSEVAGKARRGFWSSFHYVTLIMGQLLALGVLILLQRTMDPAALGDWGWRIPFFIGAGLAVVVFWIRLGLQESKSFETAREEGAARSQSRLLFLTYPKETLMIMGLTASGSLSFYAYTTYMQKYLVNSAGFNKNAATEITAAALICFMLAQPAMGWFSDKLGRKRMLVGAFGVGALMAWPVFTGIAGAGGATTAFAILFGALLVQSAYTSISAVIKAELFPTHVRALGVALPYALANAMFGGTAEYVALWFKSIGAESGFFIYVSAMSAIACAVAISMRDTRLKSAILED
ncbi:MAG: MFS transporter [Alphaproteobacteria bacterium]|nr:MFS transporter [Alphaproteobacteria bacterium]